MEYKRAKDNNTNKLITDGLNKTIEIERHWKIQREKQRKRQKERQREDIEKDRVIDTTKRQI